MGIDLLCLSSSRVNFLNLILIIHFLQVIILNNNSEQINLVKNKTVDFPEENRLHLMQSLISGIKVPEITFEVLGVCIFNLFRTFHSCQTKKASMLEDSLITTIIL
ncbi:MAG: hypothetical protein WCA84_19130 [Ignavibacteriaceae bacterium]